MTDTRSCKRKNKGSGGEGGILFRELLKIPVLKVNPNHVKLY
jgi:hypothetical protein